MHKQASPISSQTNQDPHQGDEIGKDVKNGPPCQVTQPVSLNDSSIKQANPHQKQQQSRLGLGSGAPLQLYHVEIVPSTTSSATTTHPQRGSLLDHRTSSTTHPSERSFKSSSQIETDASSSATQSHSQLSTQGERTIYQSHLNTHGSDPTPLSSQYSLVFRAKHIGDTVDPAGKLKKQSQYPIPFYSASSTLSHSYSASNEMACLPHPERSTSGDHGDTTNGGKMTSNDSFSSGLQVDPSSRSGVFQSHFGSHPSAPKPSGSGGKGSTTTHPIHMPLTGTVTPNQSSKLHQPQSAQQQPSSQGATDPEPLSITFPQLKLSSSSSSSSSDNRGVLPHFPVKLHDTTDVHQWLLFKQYVDHHATNSADARIKDDMIPDDLEGLNTRVKGASQSASPQPQPQSLSKLSTTTHIPPSGTQANTAATENYFDALFDGVFPGNEEKQPGAQAYSLESSLQNMRDTTPVLSFPGITTPTGDPMVNNNPYSPNHPFFVDLFRDPSNTAGPRQTTLRPSAMASGGGVDSRDSMLMSSSTLFQNSSFASLPRDLTQSRSTYLGGGSSNLMDVFNGGGSSMMNDRASMNQSMTGGLSKQWSTIAMNNTSQLHELSTYPQIEIKNGNVLHPDCHVHGVPYRNNADRFVWTSKKNKHKVYDSRHHDIFKEFFTAHGSNQSIDFTKFLPNLPLSYCLLPTGGLPYLMRFLGKEYALESGLFLIAVNKYRRAVADPSFTFAQVQEIAQGIWLTYFTPSTSKDVYEINIPSGTRADTWDQLRCQIKNGLFSADLFDDASLVVYNLIKTGVYPRFLVSNEYKQLVLSLLIQLIRSHQTYSQSLGKKDRSTSTSKLPFSSEIYSNPLMILLLLNFTCETYLQNLSDEQSHHRERSRRVRRNQELLVNKDEIEKFLAMNNGQNAVNSAVIPPTDSLSSSSTTSSTSAQTSTSTTSTHHSSTNQQPGSLFRTAYPPMHDVKNSPSDNTITVAQSSPSSQNITDHDVNLPQMTPSSNSHPSSLLPYPPPLEPAPTQGDSSSSQSAFAMALHSGTIFAKRGKDLDSLISSIPFKCSKFMTTDYNKLYDQVVRSRQLNALTVYVQNHSQVTDSSFNHHYPHTDITENDHGSAHQQQQVQPPALQNGASPAISFTSPHSFSQSTRHIPFSPPQKTIPIAASSPTAQSTTEKSSAHEEDVWGSERNPHSSTQQRRRPSISTQNHHYHHHSILAKDFQHVVPSQPRPSTFYYKTHLHCIPSSDLDPLATRTIPSAVGSRASAPLSYFTSTHCSALGFRMYPIRHFSSSYDGLIPVESDEHRSRSGSALSTGTYSDISSGHLTNSTIQTPDDSLEREPSRVPRDQALHNPPISQLNEYKIRRYFLGAIPTVLNNAKINHFHVPSQQFIHIDQPSFADKYTLDSFSLPASWLPNSPDYAHDRPKYAVGHDDSLAIRSDLVPVMKLIFCYSLWQARVAEASPMGYWYSLSRLDAILPPPLQQSLESTIKTNKIKIGWTAAKTYDNQTGLLMKGLGLKYCPHSHTDVCLLCRGDNLKMTCFPKMSDVTLNHTALHEFSYQSLTKTFQGTLPPPPPPPPRNGKRADPAATAVGSVKHFTSDDLTSLSYNQVLAGHTLNVSTTSTKIQDAICVHETITTEDILDHIDHTRVVLPPPQSPTSSTCEASDQTPQQHSQDGVSEEDIDAENHSCSVSPQDETHDPSIDGTGDDSPENTSPFTNVPIRTRTTDVSSIDIVRYPSCVSSHDLPPEASLPGAGVSISTSTSSQLDTHPIDRRTSIERMVSDSKTTETIHESNSPLVRGFQQQQEQPDMSLSSEHTSPGSRPVSSASLVKSASMQTSPQSTIHMGHHTLCSRHNSVNSNANMHTNTMIVPSSSSLSLELQSRTQSNLASSIDNEHEASHLHGKTAQPVADQGTSNSGISRSHSHLASYMSTTPHPTLIFPHYSQSSSTRPNTSQNPGNTPLDLPLTTDHQRQYPVSHHQQASNSDDGSQTTKTTSPLIWAKLYNPSVDYFLQFFPTISKNSCAYGACETCHNSRLYLTPAAEPPLYTLASKVYHLTCAFQQYFHPLHSSPSSNARGLSHLTGSSSLQPHTSSVSSSSTTHNNGSLTPLATPSRPPIPRRFSIFQNKPTVMLDTPAFLNETKPIEFTTHPECCALAVVSAGFVASQPHVPIVAPAPVLDKAQAAQIFSPSKVFSFGMSPLTLPHQSPVGSGSSATHSSTSPQGNHALSSSASPILHFQHPHGKEKDASTTPTNGDSNTTPRTPHRDITPLNVLDPLLSYCNHPPQVNQQLGAGSASHTRSARDQSFSSSSSIGALNTPSFLSSHGYLEVETPASRPYSMPPLPEAHPLPPTLAQLYEADGRGKGSGAGASQKNTITTLSEHTSNYGPTGGSGSHSRPESSSTSPLPDRMNSQSTPSSLSPLDIQQQPTIVPLTDFRPEKPRSHIGYTTHNEREHSPELTSEMISGHPGDESSFTHSTGEESSPQLRSLPKFNEEDKLREIAEHGLIVEPTTHMKSTSSGGNTPSIIHSFVSKPDRPPKKLVQSTGDHHASNSRSPHHGSSSTTGYGRETSSRTSPYHQMKNDEMVEQDDYLARSNPSASRMTEQQAGDMDRVSQNETGKRRILGFFSRKPNTRRHRRVLRESQQQLTQQQQQQQQQMLQQHQYDNSMAMHSDPTLGEDLSHMDGRTSMMGSILNKLRLTFSANKIPSNPTQPSPPTGAQMDHRALPESAYYDSYRRPPQLTNGSVTSTNSAASTAELQGAFQSPSHQGDASSQNSALDASGNISLIDPAGDISLKNITIPSYPELDQRYRPEARHAATGGSTGSGGFSLRSKKQNPGIPDVPYEKQLASLLHPIVLNGVVQALQHLPNGASFPVACLCQNVFDLFEYQREQQRQRNSARSMQANTLASNTRNTADSSRQSLIFSGQGSFSVPQNDRLTLSKPQKTLISSTTNDSLSKETTMMSYSSFTHLPFDSTPDSRISSVPQQYDEPLQRGSMIMSSSHSFMANSSFVDPSALIVPMLLPGGITKEDLFHFYDPSPYYSVSTTKQADPVSSTISFPTPLYRQAIAQLECDSSDTGHPSGISYKDKHNRISLPCGCTLCLCSLCRVEKNSTNIANIQEPPMLGLAPTCQLTNFPSTSMANNENPFGPEILHHNNHHDLCQSPQHVSTHVRLGLDAVSLPHLVTTTTTLPPTTSTITISHSSPSQIDFSNGACHDETSTTTPHKSSIDTSLTVLPSSNSSISNHTPSGLPTSSSMPHSVAASRGTRTSISSIPTITSSLRTSESGSLHDDVDMLDDTSFDSFVSVSLADLPPRSSSKAPTERTIPNIPVTSSHQRFSVSQVSTNYSVTSGKEKELFSTPSLKANTIDNDPSLMHSEVFALHENASQQQRPYTASQAGSIVSLKEMGAFRSNSSVDTATSIPATSSLPQSGDSHGMNTLHNNQPCLIHEHHHFSHHTSKEVHKRSCTHHKLNIDLKHTPQSFSPPPMVDCLCTCTFSPAVSAAPCGCLQVTTHPQNIPSVTFDDECDQLTQVFENIKLLLLSSLGGVFDQFMTSPVGDQLIKCLAHITTLQQDYYIDMAVPHSLQSFSVPKSIGTPQQLAFLREHYSQNGSCPHHGGGGGGIPSTHSQSQSHSQSGSVSSGSTTHAPSHHHHDRHQHHQDSLISKPDGHLCGCSCHFMEHKKLFDDHNTLHGIEIAHHELTHVMNHLHTQTTETCGLFRSSSSSTGHHHDHLVDYHHGKHTHYLPSTVTDVDTDIIETSRSNVSSIPEDGPLKLEPAASSHQHHGMSTRRPDVTTNRHSSLPFIFQPLDVTPSTPWNNGQDLHQPSQDEPVIKTDRSPAIHSHGLFDLFTAPPPLSTIDLSTQPPPSLTPSGDDPIDFAQRDRKKSGVDGSSPQQSVTPATTRDNSGVTSTTPPKPSLEVLQVSESPGHLSASPSIPITPTTQILLPDALRNRPVPPPTPSTTRSPPPVPPRSDKRKPAEPGLPRITSGIPVSELSLAQQQAGSDGDAVSPLHRTHDNASDPHHELPSETNGKDAHVIVVDGASEPSPRKDRALIPESSSAAAPQPQQRQRKPFGMWIKMLFSCTSSDPNEYS